MNKIISSLSKMWLKVINLEQSLFSELQASLGTLSSKEEKLIKILDFAEIEKNITFNNITHIKKDREQIAGAFIAKSVYNLQTTTDLIDRLRIDRTLREQIYQHMDGNLQVSDLAKQYKISERGLQNAFNSLFGLPQNSLCVNSNSTLFAMISLSMSVQRLRLCMWLTNGAFTIWDGFPSFTPNSLKKTLLKHRKNLLMMSKPLQGSAW